MKPQDRQTTLWLICFLILMGLFYWVHQHPGVQSVLLQDLARINTGLAAWWLSLLGLELQQAGTSLIGPSGTIEIARSCTGSLVFLVFAAAVIPFPASRRSRLLGILVAIPVLFAINLLRICVIVLVVSRFPRSLQVLHLIVGQAIVIAGMLLYFLWWARKSESGVSFAFTRSRRLVLQTAGLFLLAYLCGFWLYGEFLQSPPGAFVQEQIRLHADWLISGANRLLSLLSCGDGPAADTVPSVELISGCLSSPVVVFFAALAFAWPASWWKKLAVIILCFLPFFYGYHLLRAVLIAATLGFQTKQGNLVYNLYGQVMLSLALLAIIAVYWHSRLGRSSGRRLAAGLLAGAAAGTLLGTGAALLAGRIVAPFLSSALTGTEALPCDPQQTLSLMPFVQVFIWTTLMLMTPEQSRRKQALGICLGIIGVFLLFAWSAAVIAIFRLNPHVGLFKLGVVLLPFLVYTLMLARQRRLRP